jgi:hypothetical protein
VKPVAAGFTHLSQLPGPMTSRRRSSYGVSPGYEVKPTEYGPDSLQIPRRPRAEKGPIRTVRATGSGPRTPPRFPRFFAVFRVSIPLNIGPHPAVVHSVGHREVHKSRAGHPQKGNADLVVPRPDGSKVSSACPRRCMVLGPQIFVLSPKGQGVGLPTPCPFQLRAG